MRQNAYTPAGIIKSSKALALACAALACLIAGSARASGPTKAEIEKIVTYLGQNAIDSGHAVGAGVSVIRGGAKPILMTFGYANAANQTPFASNSLFEIASTTKVFTTNLLGQAVVKKRFELAETLGSLSAEVGAFVSPLGSKVKLKELGDFTAGFPDLAPLCANQNVAGCLPSIRPTLSQYTTANFLDFFQNATPSDYTQGSPVALTKLPGPYFYSNFSVGLLGLILGNPGKSIASTDSATAVDNWYELVDSEILTPLGMTETFLDVPASIPATQIVGGYSPATATAEVANGKITAINVSNAGGKYASAPQVTISGGGGAGGAATAVLGNGGVTSVEVTSNGSGYVGPANVSLNKGGSSETASVSAIVSDGKVVAFRVNAGGSGYVRAPKATVTGGRAASGTDATATAHIANGEVTAVTVDNGGSGYVDPLEVKIAPGATETNVVPVWAAAGALHSSLSDMTSFASAALGETSVGGKAVPAAMTQGFALAETPRACNTGAHAKLGVCPAGTQQTGLAWELVPADPSNGMPQIVTKNGALTGFSSQTVLVPSHDFAVVVLVNSDDDIPALHLAFQIAYDLIYAGL